MAAQSRWVSKVLNEHEAQDDDVDDDRSTIDSPVLGKDHFVHRVEDAAILRLTDSNSEYPPVTIPSFFAKSCRKHKRKPAFVTFNTIFNTISYEEYYRRALSVAKGLIQLGLKPHEGVGFMCQLSVRMFDAIMGAILAGGVFVDLYAPGNKTWLINTMAEAKVAFVFVDSIFTRDIQLDVWDELVHMRSIIITEASATSSIQDSRTVTLQQLIKEGIKVKQDMLAHRIGTHAPNRCCAIFYRSNETLNQPNTPGVMMSHDSLTLMAVLLGEKILNGELGDFSHLHKKSYRLIPTLPITKPAAFVIELLLPLAIGGSIHIFNSNIKARCVWTWVPAVEPHILCVTNKMWIQLRNRIVEKTRGLTNLKGWLFEYAKKRMLDSHLKGKPLPKLARIVIEGVTERLGIRKVGLFLCFGAALPQMHFEYFLSLNIQVIPFKEDDFLSGPNGVCMNRNNIMADSIGTIFPQFEKKMIRLGKTGAHRLFVKGRHMCMGILQSPKLELVDDEGFLDTQSLIMSIEEEVFVVGSTRDEVVLKTGAVLSCRGVENCFKRLLPIVASCMVVGDNMAAAGLLITLKTVINPDTLQATDLLPPEVQAWCEQKLETQYSSAKFLAGSKKLHVVINVMVVSINNLIRRCGGWIEAYKILPRNFSILDMEIDPVSLELNRNLIKERYRDDILTLYPNADY
ncbi:hypothetical protein EGW08_007186 [Elysia chlorotica]|uniref:long-chain-fatty-acid--CoA ligase n=1 Tax=Elysia chlorotica TaxID=188477 RepID=A0A433TU32_ELYCH|nr:hypothetical protein EGW08_007186 [Elysia chlorotica]